jgi:hypothetical protein
MIPESVASAVPAVGFVLAVWLGAYLVTARGSEKTAVMAAASMFSLALYFLHAVLCLHVPAVQAGFLWRRFLGWFVLPFFAFWLHLGVEASGSPGRAWQRPLLLLSYGSAVALSALWLWGKWTFVSSSFEPIELRAPVTAYGVAASAAAIGVWLSSARGSGRGFRLPMALISGAWGLGAAVLPHLRLPAWPVRTPVIVGESLLILGIAVSMLLIGRTGLFLRERSLGRDMLYHLASSAALLFLYGGAIALSSYFAARLGFHPLTLSTIVVLGLVILTHLVADDVRSLWDRLFFRNLSALRSDLRSLARDLSRDDRIVAVEKWLRGLKSILGARWTCLFLATELAPPLPARIGDVVDETALTREGEGREVLRQPVYLGEDLVGQLAAGEKVGGGHYGHEERLWFAFLPARFPPFSATRSWLSGRRSNWRRCFGN